MDVSAEMQALVEHLVLPTRLPSQQSPNIDDLSKIALAHLKTACQQMMDTKTKLFSPLEELHNSLVVCEHLNKGSLDQAKFSDYLVTMRPGEVVTLYMAAQNAALMLRREANNSVNEDIIFEAFEVSPKAVDVLAVSGSLQWQFPGRAVKISASEFQTTSFRSVFETFLSQAHGEHLVEMDEEARKAGTNISEIRETSKPDVITKLLMPILEAIGSQANVSPIRKRIRDDVSYANALHPWRRLPFWLVLRIHCRRQLGVLLGDVEGRICYKFLMCMLLTSTLRNVHKSIPIELAITLRSKICRRLKKLEDEQKEANGNVRPLYDLLFQMCSTIIEREITSATTHIESTVDDYKRDSLLKLPELYKDSTLTDRTLTLHNSKDRIEEALSKSVNASSKEQTKALSPIEKFAYKSLIQQIDTMHSWLHLESQVRDELSSQTILDEACIISRASTLAKFVPEITSSYSSDPLQKSQALLVVFEHWMIIDQSIIEKIPLCTEYQPIFPVDMLNVLQLPLLQDMKRLQILQAYLKKRHEQARQTSTIFGPVTSDCFAFVFLKSCPELQQYLVQIETASNTIRERKRSEWQENCRHYDELTSIIGTVRRHCAEEYDEDEIRPTCLHCNAINERHNMSTAVHEDLLPLHDQVRKSVMVFELAIPHHYSAYRDISWFMFRQLTHPGAHLQSQPALSQLHSYSQLRNFDHAPARQAIRMGALEKSFLIAHYSTRSFAKGKPSEKEVLLPHAMKFDYLDDSQTWLGNLHLPPTLQHLCGIYVPGMLRSTVLPAVTHPLPNHDKLSSYRIQANQTLCPSDTSPHEFQAFQELLSGSRRIWSDLIRELGSVNLDFRKYITSTVLVQLGNQAGSHGNQLILRDTHVVFEEENFVERLLKLLYSRLDSIRGNWRESSTMEVILSFGSRLFQLGSESSQQSAITLIRAARDVLIQWLNSLRHDFHQSTDSSEITRLAACGLRAALLCRFSFNIVMDRQEAASLLEPDMSSYLQATIALQEYMLSDPATECQTVKTMITRDIRLMIKLKPLISQAIKINSNVMTLALKAVWDRGTSSSDLYFEPWEFIKSHPTWAVTTKHIKVSGRSVKQIIHFNFMQGYLLVDGETLGKLPVDIQSSSLVKELYGDRRVLTYASALPGMTHCAVKLESNHEVHFGRRADTIIVQVLTKDDKFEIIPRKAFQNFNDDELDLPQELISGCIHFFSLDTGKINIRKSTTPWISGPEDWIIDYRSRKGYKADGSVLIDPRSDIARRIFRVFADWESSPKIVILQNMTLSTSILVELHHLELSFLIDNKNRLYCRELHAYITTDQDAGTFYGLKSKLVLCDAAKRRSIIVPLGPISSLRDGIHVATKTMNAKLEYVKFGIDPILGRLTHSADSRLVYFKALLHALTSLPLPDPLTGFSGVEAAFAILESGSAQPCFPLDPFSLDYLQKIAALSPKRSFYPRHLKCMQSVEWNHCLTTTIQHDGFHQVARELLHQSSQLQAFESVDPSLLTLLAEEGFLSRRARGRQSLYARPGRGVLQPISLDDKVYLSRDRDNATSVATNIYSLCISMLRPKIKVPEQDLIKILESWSDIGGFTKASVNPSLQTAIYEKIPPQFGSLVKFCQTSHKYQLIFRLSLLAFGGASVNILLVLAAFGQNPSLRKMQTPNHSSYTTFECRGSPSASSTRAKLDSLDTRVPPGRNAKGGRKQIYQEYITNFARDVERAIPIVLAKWPSETFTLEAHEFTSNLFTASGIVSTIQTGWKSRMANDKLAAFIQQVNVILKGIRGDLITYSPYSPATTQIFSPGSKLSPTLQALAKDADHISECPSVLSNVAGKGSTSTSTKSLASSDILTLIETILTKFINSASDDIRKTFGKDLINSLTALKRRQNPLQSISEVKKTNESRLSHLNHIGQIRSNLTTSSSNWLKRGGLLPSMTVIDLLMLLQSSNIDNLPPNLRQRLIEFGMSISSHQQFIRIGIAKALDNHTLLQVETTFQGHCNWKPNDYVDWLLFEIDNNLLIRSEQVDVAKAIMAPASGKNSVLQLNMGAGKTSVILPIALALLADKKYLARIVVPNALLNSTAQLLQSRLGSLLDRSLKSVPFWRRTPPTSEMLTAYAEIHGTSLEKQNMIITTPEQILSFQLSTWQVVADQKTEAVSRMNEQQAWFDSHCRDVIDESDYSLAVKTQLIYPGGTQLLLDGHPTRWQVIEELISLIQDHLEPIKERLPQSVDIGHRDGFPTISFLRNDAEIALTTALVDDICTGRSNILRLRETGSDLSSRRRTLNSVLTTAEWNEVDFHHAVGLCRDTDQAPKIILLLRGLLQSILILCLKKRWNVQYGLHPRRDPLAVPYEARGVPSERSEFGHPDVALVLTCLAFYYSGITYDQFRQDLKLVLDADDLSNEWVQWTSLSTLPEDLREWNVINIDNNKQVHRLWKHLRLQKNVIDHFLNNFVFPRHAKQFETKLQASAWDIPIFDARLENALARTTGFSGTNDTKSMLPLTISQDDLPHLAHTNAEVLSYLLQPRNRTYVVAVDGKDKRLSESGLLQALTDKGIRLLIDAGAYILEKDNHTVAKEWLDIDKTVSAAVFFNNKGVALVQYRNKSAPVALSSTPLVSNLSDVLVYFDEAHTRGVDLKFPPETCAALTLALGQTKDHTLQAAMRLRQLATTQSIVFYSPPEVHQSIIDVCKPSNITSINSEHVIEWPLEQTCKQMENLHGLYINQGQDYCRRMDTIINNSYFVRDKNQKEALLDVLCHKERQTLADLYGNSASMNIQSKSLVNANLQDFSKTLTVARNQSNTTARISDSSALEEVEQEREVECQVEQVRQVEKPGKREPHTFPGLHPAIKNFVDTGYLTGNRGYMQVFSALARTSIGKTYKVEATKDCLYMSVEFERTVMLKQGEFGDRFLRDVNWLLYSPTTQTALIIIPEEAELIIPLLRSERDNDSPSKVHLIVYSAPITKSMLHFGTYDFYTLPPLPSNHTLPASLTITIGLFTGRLYLKYDEVDGVKKFLGLTQSDGSRNQNTTGGFTNTPTTFVTEWLALKRKQGDGGRYTPMGYVLQDRPLTTDHVFFNMD